MASYSHLTPNDPQASAQTPRRRIKRYVQAGFFNTLGCALVAGLVLVGSMNAAAQTAAVGFDPLKFRVAYTVPGGPLVGQLGEPIYKVEAPFGSLNFNTSQTPFLLPCDIDRFGIDVFAESAASSVSVQWAVTISFFELKPNNTESPVGTNGCLGTTPTLYSGTGGVTPVLNPGDEAEAGFTPIDSVDLPGCQFQFQPTDLKKNRPVRMHVALQLYTPDNTFTTPVTNTDTTTNAFDFWLMRANTGSCP